MKAEFVGQKQYDASYRCDRCNAQAVGEVHVSTGVLYFCGHHGRVYLPALVMAGAEVRGAFGSFAKVEG